MPTAVSTLTPEAAPAAMPDQPKNSLRDQMRARLQTIAPCDHWWLSGNACRQVSAMPKWDQARCVMVFAPLPWEINVMPLALVALECGVQVCVPRVDWDRRQMVPALVKDWAADLLPDRHGLLNPRPDAPVAPVESIDAVLVPGLAFDREGRRLGRGGGYYDRLLSDPRLRAVRLGVGFSVQVVDTVPVGAHDCSVEWVVTDLGVIDCSAARRPVPKGLGERPSSPAKA